MTVTVTELERTGRPPGGERYTVEELARKVGMSPRNIRAHQARRLLPPPVRIGRTAYYDASHVRRMEAIKSLQRQGFNLAAIDAILGAQGPSPDAEKVADLLQRLGAEQPTLVYALSRHGVLGRAEDGTVRTVRPRALRSALDLRQAGVQTVASLQLLDEVLDALGRVANELVQATSTRIRALSLRPVGAVTSWEQLDQQTVQFTQSLVGLLTEAFRVAVENQGHAAVETLLAGDLDLEPQVYEMQLDNG